MAKVTGPLLSLSAIGKFAKTIEFKKWGDFFCVRKKSRLVSSFNPNTQNQIFYRRYFSDLVNMWQNLNSVDKKALDKNVDNKSLSGFNFFISAGYNTKPTYCGLTRCGFSHLGYLTFLG